MASASIINNPLSDEEISELFQRTFELTGRLVDMSNLMGDLQAEQEEYESALSTTRDATLYNVKLDLIRINTGKIEDIRV